MIKIVKKNTPTPLRENLTRILAVVFAFVASGIIIALIGYNPFEVYWKIIENSLFTFMRFEGTMNKAIILIVLSLGIAIAFRMKFWNIGAEGQFYMGAFGATWMALWFPDLPSYILLPLMFISAFVYGAIWALIPAVIKAKFATSETLVTLMMNYIAIAWVSYLQYGPWRDPEALGAGKIPRFSESAVLPKVFGIHIGWIIALVLVVILTILFKYSKLGYQIDVLGESETTAKYAGMNTLKIMIIAVLISGGLCGTAGMMQASAVEKSLSDSLSGGLGFTAVITAWLAKLKPPAIVFVSFAFAMLLQSGTALQLDLKIPSSIVSIIQGIIIFFILGSEFFISYKFVFTKRISETGKENG